MELDYNPDFELAYRIIEHTDAHLFLTGRAGTGKTTFLRNLMKRTHKQMVVAAPTGIAAINAGGVTLHSLFQLDFGLFLPGMKRKPFKFNRDKLKLIRFMDVLVIDEVSMVRADLLDAVDDVLRRVRNPHAPFGGVQLLLIGDLRQLPPVVTDAEIPLLAEHYPTPYFFSSRALSATHYVTVELEKVYRQEDKHFLDILGDVRDGHPSPSTIEALNHRYIPGFTPDDKEHWVRLTSHNASANAENTRRMEALRGVPYTYNSEVSGNFPKGVCPAEELLVLKKGAQVMFVKNEQGAERRYFNGMIGTVTELDESSVTVAPDNGSEPIRVEKVNWENITYNVNEQTGEVEEKVDGIFKQIPLRAAWAITIHKSQGLTFTRAMVDASACFAHGQAYVALSRLRSLEGLVLTAPLPSYAVISDSTVSNFMEAQAASRPQDEVLMQMERLYSLNLLNSLFDFSNDERMADELHRTIVDAYQSNFPSLVRDYAHLVNSFSSEVLAPGQIFAGQYTRLLASKDSRPMLTERLAAAAGYFPAKIGKLTEFLNKLPSEVDNKQTLKRLQLQLDNLLDSLELKAGLIQSLAEVPFSNESLLKTKREIMSKREKSKAKANRSQRSKGGADKSAADSTSGNLDEIQNPNLFNALVQWRRKLAKEMDLPAYRIISTRALIHISNRCPNTKGALLMAKGCGPKTVEQFGDAIMNILSEYSE